MNIVIIDGQGGKIGALLATAIKKNIPNANCIAIGTNSIATSAMLKAGADKGATGENPVLVACRQADVIVGPIGILAADSLLGEITPKMAVAVGQSSAHKILIPTDKCDITVVGVQPLSIAERVILTLQKIISLQ